MTEIRNYDFSEKNITAFVIDESSPGFIWIAFAKDASNICHLKKVSVYNPLQIYFDLELEVDEIKKLYISGTAIYLALDDSSYIGYKYSLTNPLSSYSALNLPAGITEAPVDLIISGSYIYYLIPGISSGTNTKIVKTTTSGTFVETIDLSTIHNAYSFVMDDNEDFWIATYESPTTIARVYQTSGGSYTYTTY